MPSGVHLIEELQVFEEAQPIKSLVLSVPKVRKSLGHSVWEELDTEVLVPLGGKKIRICRWETDWNWCARGCHCEFCCIRNPEVFVFAFA